MDDLERRVRAARPISGHRDLPLSDRSKRELADLLLAESHSAARGRARHRRVRAVGTAIALTTMAVIASIVASTVLMPQAAIAATPPLLEVTPTQRTAHDLLLGMSQALQAGSSTSQPDPIRLHVRAWTLQTGDDGRATSSTVVPENYEITRGIDGSFSTRVTAGQPVDRAGEPVRGDGIPSEGDLVWEETWAAGEYQFLFPDPFPNDHEAVDGYFRQALGATRALSAASAIQAVNDLLFEQQLADAQEAALLVYLASLPDLRASGEVRDRLGREGVIFVAPDQDRPGYERHLIVSPDTGRILATETIYTGTDRTDIASPSVVNYFIWK